nr:zeta toxin family protein [Mycolicibacterium sp. BK634]
MRNEVAQQLIALAAPGQPLHADSDRRTVILYAADRTRAGVRKQIVNRYLDLASPRQDGRSAIITAGPPGAGKSTTLSTEIPDLDDYRILDADVVKEYLIEQAMADGIYDDLLVRILADNHPIAPNELAALVHDESVQIIESIRQTCLAHRENIVVEATLQWDDHGPSIFGQLAANDYATVRILAVEADRALVHEQALDRWWRRRREWTDGQRRLGGRFVPPAAIDRCYPAIGRSTCSENAIALIDRARGGEIERVRLTLFQRDADQQPRILVDETIETP